jgi:hypothetical protein
MAWPAHDMPSGAGEEHRMSRQHLLQLTRKHQDLDAKILEETRSPSSDDLALAALKRQKLKLKEQIAQVERSL